MDKTLGDDFIPSDQELKVYVVSGDNFFTMKTVKLDSLNTAGFGTGTLGRINDSRVGTTTAGFVTTFIPAAYSPTFGTGVTGFDSVYLWLRFSSTSGTNNTDMKVKVYEVNKNLSDTSVFTPSLVYYGTPAFAQGVCDPTPVNEGSPSFNVDSSGVYIKLSSSLLPKLFQLSSADAFAASFKGLYVTVEDGNGEGCIKYVDLVNTSTTVASSALVAYYHYRDTVANKDSSTIFTYHVYSSSPRFNVYGHDYAALSKPNTTLYMQGLGGVATQMTFNLDSVQAWANSRHYAVNRVELVLPLVDDNDADMLSQYSTQLRCMTKESNGYYSTRDIFSPSGALNPAFDGKINRSLMQYSLNITHFFNDVLLKGKATPMIVVPYNYTSEIKNVFVRNDATKKPQLRITYGEIK